MRRPLQLDLLSRLVRERRGASAVEFALIAPILFLLLAGLIDGSRLAIRTMQIRAAAQAGADYALRKGWDPTAIEEAVANATPLTAAASPAPAETTGCIVGGAVVQSAGPNCPNGGPAGQFVTVWAQAPFSPLMAWPGVPLPSQLTARAEVRIP
ncbi:MAG: pilus assembly protein [Alphaproteobacteria bacterium]|nr:pilus assembly protein [Alphaproteobacteria bacterium]